MPAQRLELQRVDIRQLDVIGLDSDSVPHFVRHVGLSTENKDQFTHQDRLSLTHMGPPLEHGSAPGPVHSTGNVPLNADEIQQISVFVDEIRSEYEANKARDRRDQYVIRPHVKPRCEADGTVLYYRFNCAGFVIEAYRYAGIVLLLTEEENLPSVPLAVLLAAYPDQKDWLESERLRERINLPGDGPWPVVLAGYVVNALARPEREIREGATYRAAVGDEYFPPRLV